MAIEGIAELLGKCKAKVVVHKAEAEFLKGLAPSDIIKAESGDTIDVGGRQMRVDAVDGLRVAKVWLSTPKHREPERTQSAS
jgi:flavorubredoxin